MTARRYAAEVTRLPMLAVFEARGREADLAAAMQKSGLKLPPTLNRAEDSKSRCRILRLGPRRALVLADADFELRLDGRLAQGFATAAAADYALVSDMLVAFQIKGSGSEDVLRQGAPLDLSIERFPPGSCAATDLWSASVIVIREAGEAPQFTLLVERSYAGYIEDWLTVASGGSSTLRPGTMISPPASFQPS